MGRVLIRKSDGVPVEYQSAATAGTLVQNAVNAGLSAGDFDEIEISGSDYALLQENKIDKPERDARKNKKNLAKSKIKAKLQLTDNDIEDLKEALK